MTLVTLIFAPLLQNHHWVDVLVGKTTETKIVQCEPSEPCPAEQHITQKVILPKR
ncbi:MAG TPA: hypothetical protein VGJ77_16410 [Gaiellaceae bacterium]